MDIEMCMGSSPIASLAEDDIIMQEAPRASAPCLNDTSVGSFPFATREAFEVEEGQIFDIGTQPSVSHQELPQTDQRLIRRNRPSFLRSRTRPNPRRAQSNKLANLHRVPTGPRQVGNYPDCYIGPGPTFEATDLLNDLKMDGPLPDRRDHGGRRNFQGGNRKRRFRDDERDERPARRNKYEEPIASQLRRSILNIGDQVSQYRIS